MAKDKIYEGKIPIRRNSNGTLQQLDWYQENSWMKDVELVDNYIFEDTLRYKEYGKGRSSVTFYFESDKGDKYTMFISDFDDLLQDRKEVWNLDGRFAFRKQGANFGIKYLGPREMKVSCDFCGETFPASQMHTIPCSGTDSRTGRDSDDWACPQCWEKRR